MMMMMMMRRRRCRRIEWTTDDAIYLSLCSVCIRRWKDTYIKAKYIKRWWVDIESFLGWKRWNNQHDTSEGQRKNLSPRRESNGNRTHDLLNARPVFGTSWVRFPTGSQFSLCPTFVSCWLFYLYHFITELKNSPSFISLSFLGVVFKEHFRIEQVFLLVQT